MKKLIILIGCVLLLGIVFVFVQTQSDVTKKKPQDELLSVNADDVLERALNTNTGLKSYSVLLKRTHQKIQTADNQIQTVGTESYQFKVIRKHKKPNQIVWETNPRDTDQLSNATKKRDSFFSIDVDSILKSKDDYLVRIQGIQKSKNHTFYLVEMRHKKAKLADGQQPTIQLQIDKDNGMVYNYRLIGADLTERARADFEYNLIQGFWLPVKTIIRLPFSGDIFIDVITYSQLKTEE